MPKLTTADRALTTADGAPDVLFQFFQQLAMGPRSLDSHRDSVFVHAIGLKSYLIDAEIWHLHLSMFLTHTQCVVET